MTTEIIHELAVEIDGSGEPVLCIHGLGGSSNVWTPILPALAGRSVIRLDLPGSARSALPKAPLSIASYVASIKAALDALQLGAVDVLAHSMGTIVAQHLAVLYPEHVKSLALFGPLAAPADAARPHIQARATLARTGLAAMQEIANAIVAGAVSQETRQQQPIVTALVRESIMRQSPEGYAQSCEALANAQSAALENIKVPVLLATGDQDGVAPPANVEAMGQRLGNAQVLVLPECGHWQTYEKPMQCIEALRSFLATSNPQRG